MDGGTPGTPGYRCPVGTLWHKFTPQIALLLHGLPCLPAVEQAVLLRINFCQCAFQHRLNAYFTTLQQSVAYFFVRSRCFEPGCQRFIPQSGLLQNGLSLLPEPTEGADLCSLLLFQLTQSGSLTVSPGFQPSSRIQWDSVLNADPNAFHVIIESPAAVVAHAQCKGGHLALVLIMDLAQSGLRFFLLHGDQPDEGGAVPVWRG